MKRVALFILILLSPCLGVSAYAATYSFNAQTDRQQLYLGESIELTLELDDLSYFVEPDISALKHSFELLSSQRSNPINADNISVQQWVFKLLPKHAGELEIPTIELGKYTSQPIKVQVKNFLPPKELGIEPVYMDSQVDKEQVYVQAQVMLTLRIYHSVPLYASGQLSSLSMPQARVIPLGKPRSFEQFINGVRHGVIEIRYALFPQTTGTLTIPSLQFTATLTGHDPSSLEPPSNLPGQQVEVYSARIPIEVLPPPTQFPSDSPWLPAQALQLEQQWSPEQGELNTEQALTRSLTVRAQGLPSSSIPALLTRQPEHFYRYANPILRQHSISEHGIISLTQEQLALVAIQSGHYQLPAIKLPWWNTDSDQLEYAELPAYSVRFTPKKNELSLNQSLSAYQNLLIWQFASAVLALTCVVLLLLWRRARYQPAINSHSSADTTRLVENLKRACKNNHPSQARAALDALARHTNFTPNAAARRSKDFHHALTDLNAVLYTETEQQWHGQALWQAFADLNNAQLKQEQQALPPLYPP